MPMTWTWGNLLAMDVPLEENVEVGIFKRGGEERSEYEPNTTPTA